MRPVAARDPITAFAYVMGSSEASVQQYADAHGIQIVRTFREEDGCEAKDVARRPALNEMLRALRSHEVRLVLFEKLDTVALYTLIGETMAGGLQMNGFELISVATSNSQLVR
jgi:DNA invertase Pin-like site-specific DNA recombinase